MNTLPGRILALAVVLPLVVACMLLWTWRERRSLRLNAAARWRL